MLYINGFVSTLNELYKQIARKFFVQISKFWPKNDKISLE